MTLEEYIKDRGTVSKGVRFLYITDLHIRNKAPKMWKADYVSAFLQQLSWICTLPQKIGAHTSIICGGDVFDIPVVNLERADDFMDVLVGHGCRMLTAVGNHDVESTLATLPRSTLGHLMRRSPSTIRLLPIIKHKPFILEGIHLWAHHYRYMNHQEIIETSIYDHSAPRIVVSHSMLLKHKPVFEEEQYRLFEDIQTNANLLLLGHYHPQQQQTVLSNPYRTNIAAPGAFMRGALSRDDLSRRPSVAVIEFTQGDILRVDYLELDYSVAPEPSEIFKLEEATAELAKVQALDNFRVNLSSLKVHNSSVAELIEAIAKSDQIEEPVKQEALRRVGVI